MLHFREGIREDGGLLGHRVIPIVGVLGESLANGDEQRLR
jgi:hypothetical protein